LKPCGRCREPESGGGEVRVYPGRVAGAGDTFVTVSCRGDDAVTDLMAAALDRFGLDPTRAAPDYRCSEILLDRGGKTVNNRFIISLLMSLLLGQRDYT
jgi:hypothetical protein